MQRPGLSRAVPTAIGSIVLIAGALQFTDGRRGAWPAAGTRPDTNARCRSTPIGAWRLGLRVGLQCFACCGNLMLILLLAGVMDLTAMTAMTAAITLERVAPAGLRVARAVGLVAVVAGVLLIARAAALV